jgi:alpha-glucosidase
MMVHGTQSAATGQPHWWQRGVVYEVYVRSFCDTNGDGVGDLAGVIEKLSYLVWLGVDAIWLTPFYPSPMKDFGYDVADYTNVDPIFGDLAAFDRLVAEAHQQGIKVIVDYVPNHTSSEHTWFRQSRSSRDNPKRDWYIWRDAKPDGAPPNNWLSMFGGSAWEWDAATGQYYLHSFLKEQPDLNWRNSAVQAAMFEVARFWLEHGVDGFRIDVAHLIMKDPALRDNPPDPDPDPRWLPSLGAWARQLHLHDLGHPDVHRVYREFRQLLDTYSAKQPRVCIGELHDRDLVIWASYYGEQLDELHMPFNFHLLGVEWSATVVGAIVDAVEAALAEGAWPNWVLGNHDVPRIASHVGSAQVRVAMMLLLTLRGTPTLYYGDELGMTNGVVPPERVRDPWVADALGVGRDLQRTPMQWDEGPNAGFCPADAEPWLPIAADYERVNVAAQTEDPRSMLALTRRLLALRRGSPALSGGQYRRVEGIPDQCFAYIRHSAEQRMLVALNFSSSEHVLDLPEGMRGTIRLSTHADRNREEVVGQLGLRADEGCVLELSAERGDPLVPSSQHPMVVGGIISSGT